MMAKEMPSYTEFISTIAAYPSLRRDTEKLRRGKAAQRAAELPCQAVVG